MFIGYDFLALGKGTLFESNIYHPNYYKLELLSGMYDHIYIDEDINIPFSTDKPESWNFRTVLNAKFQGDMEAGSISAEGLQVEKIRFQRRESDGLYWRDIAEIKYKHGEQLYYETIDKYISNDFIYQYSLIPITSSIIGNRVISSEIKADFEGIFISDKDNNYMLLYDIEYGSIDHNNPSAIIEPLNAQFPIVTYSNLDYTSFDISTTFISASTIDNGIIDIKMHKTGKDQLMKFMKNGKPKVYRDINGNMKLVTVVGTPRELPKNNIEAIATLSFSLVEIGNTDSETLANNAMLHGI